MDTTVTRYTAPNAGFVRGISGLNPETLAAYADDLRFLARLLTEEHPHSGTAHAVLRGAEQLVLKAHRDAGTSAPADIPVVAPEVIA